MFLNKEYFERRKKELALKIGAGALATVMIASGLSGCANNKEEKEENTPFMSDTMNDDELQFNDIILTYLFRSTYDFNTEVTRRDKQQEIRDYLEKNAPHCFLWVDTPDLTRNYEIVMNTSEKDKNFYQIFSIENGFEEGKYEFCTFINERYTLLKNEEVNCVLDHETGNITEISRRALRPINDSYMIGNLEDYMGFIYKLYYANGEEALEESYLKAVWDLYNDDKKDTNILFLVSETYTDMVNLETREIKRLYDFTVTGTYENYIAGYTTNKEEYILAYDDFSIKQISKMPYEDGKVEYFIPPEKDCPNVIIRNPQGQVSINDINGNRLSAVGDSIFGILNYGDATKSYYTLENSFGKTIITSEGDYVLSLDPKEDSCEGVFNDDIFLIRNMKTNKAQAIKVVDGQIVGATPRGDSIEMADTVGLFIEDKEEKCLYAYDTNLNYLKKIDQEDSKGINEAHSQMKEAKVKAKTK